MSVFELRWRKFRCHPCSDTKCRIYKQATQILEGGWIVFINFLNKTICRNSQNKTQKNANAKTFFWFGPFDLRPVPKQSAWDFPFPDLDTPKTNTCTPLDRTPFVKSVQLFSTSRRQQLFEWIQWILYALNLYVTVNKVSYRWTFRILHKRIGIVWRIESRSKFSKEQNIWTEF